MYIAVTRTPKEVSPTLKEQYEAFCKNSKYSSPELIKDKVLKQIPAIFERAVSEGDKEIERECALVLECANGGTKA